MSDIDLKREITAVEQQEQLLVFKAFDNQEALDIGLRMIALAAADGKGIEIDIDREGHCLFHHAMAGTSKNNSNWIRRKRNTMHLTGTSSLLVFLRLAQEGVTISQKYGVVETEHAPGGGGFPIRLHDGSIVGYIVASGLPHKEDHALVVAALSAQLGLGHQTSTTTQK